MTLVPGNAPDPTGFRVSDVERQQVVDRLQQAVGEGLLDLEEYTERNDSALRAMTRGELAEIVRDLPTPVAPRPPANRLVLRSNMTKTYRSGAWPVPRRIEVHNQLGVTDLDFTNAELESEEVSIELNVNAGSVRLVVPTGATIDSDRLNIVAGRLKDQRRGFDRGDGSPRFVLTGQVTAGEIKIRKPGGLLAALRAIFQR